MSGSIFLLDEQERAVELREAQYQDEDLFQRLIADHPELLDCVLPLGEQRKWIFIAREVGVPEYSEGCAQWFLDHLLLSQDGVPTLVEVKRSTDGRIRREVVGQMLDYAANGCAYWSVSAFRESYEAQCKKAGQNPLAEFYSDQEAVDAYWDRVEANLRSRKVRLLFVADKIPDSLRRIIEFLNEQMADTEVLGVELRQYTSDKNHRIMVPQVIGRTTPAERIKQISTFAWTEETYLERARLATDETMVEVCRQLLREFEELGCEIYWGRGQKYPCFVPTYQGIHRHQLCAVYVYDKHIGIEIYFKHFKPPFDYPDRQRKLMEQFNQIPGIHISQNQLSKRPPFDGVALKNAESLQTFITIYRHMIDEIRAHN